MILGVALLIVLLNFKKILGEFFGGVRLFDVRRAYEGNRIVVFSLVICINSIAWFRLHECLTDCLDVASIFLKFFWKRLDTRIDWEFFILLVIGIIDIDICCRFILSHSWIGDSKIIIICEGIIG